MAAEAHSPLQQFEIQPIFSIPFHGVDLAFTNSSLWMLISALVAIVFFTIATKPRAMIPGRMQVMAEGAYTFIANMVRENTGTAGMHYFPFVFTIFMTVFLGNALGLIPHSFTYTSHIIVTAALAFLVFFMVLLIGIFRHGTHFFQLFLPPGVPLVLAPLIVPIELMAFIMRPITLALRLFANMMAGHIMLKVFAGLAVMVLGLGAAGLPILVVLTLTNTALLVFELLIAFLQAYVFTILICIYLKDSVEIGH